MKSTCQERVLVLTPTSADARLTAMILRDAGIDCHPCSGLSDLSRELQEGAGAVLLTEESLSQSDTQCLISVLTRQPSWSDIPILLLSAANDNTPVAAWAMDLLGNVTVLERPVRITTLVSAVRSALRARRRQYELRDQVEQSRMNEERFQLVLSASPVMVYTCDRELRYTWIYNNPARFDRLQVLGKRDDELLPHEQVADLIDFKAHVLDQGVSDRREIQVRFDHGSEWWDINAKPLRDSAGGIIGLRVTATDITERRRAEETLRQTELRHSVRMSLLADAAAVLLSTDDPDAMLRGVFVKLAPHLELDAYFNFMVTEAGDGLRLESYHGISVDEASKMERLEFGQAICGNVAINRQSAAAMCIQESNDPRASLVRSLGLSSYACNPLVAGDRLLGTLSFASRTKKNLAPDELDFLATISRYVAAAYERAQLIRRLRDADRHKDEFLATLAHELRNPLAPIRNALQVLRMTGANVPNEPLHEMMERQVAHLVRLVDDLLEVSRITRGKIELRKSRSDLGTIVRNAIEAAQPLIEASRHELTVELPSDPLFVEADAVRLSQVVANLLNNAAKYTDEGGRIWLTLDRRDQEAVLSVRDTGMGIPPDMLPSVFEMFSQVDLNLKRSQGGLGIGLALVRSLVTLHGGRVEAKSKGPGKGSEFLVHLPLAKPEKDREQSAEDQRMDDNGVASHRILVVDDNRDAADSLAMVLRLLGSNVHTAYDGVSALKAVESFRPDALFLDLGMPAMDGFEVARHVRALPEGRGVTLVAMTGWGQEDDKRRSRAAGFDRHLTKPVAPDLLRALLADLVP